VPKVAPADRARWAEIAISVGLSILTSAVVMAWTLSSKLAAFENTLEAQDKRIAKVERDDAEQAVDHRDQESRIAVQETRWSEVVRRLDSIDRKLER
jgi:mannitol-specific phosphotransferase system IIBC component